MEKETLLAKPPGTDLGRSPEKALQYYRKRYRQDRWARWIITLGGFSIIAGILAIMLFLLYQCLPLTFQASIEKLWEVPLAGAGSQTLLVGIDEYQEIFYHLLEDGRINVYRVGNSRPEKVFRLPLARDEQLLTAAKGSLHEEIFAAGTNQGKIFTARIFFRPHYEDGVRRMEASFTLLDSMAVFQVNQAEGTTPRHIERLVFRQNEDGLRCYAWVDHPGAVHLRIFDPDLEEWYTEVLAEAGQLGEITALAMSYNAENLLVANRRGRAFWFDLTDPYAPDLRDEWSLAPEGVTALEYLIGNQAVVVGTRTGRVSVWFPVRTPGGLVRFQEAHQFRSHPAPIVLIAASPRNRNFLTVDEQGGAHLNYSTTSQTQLEFAPADQRIRAVSFAPKSNGLVLVDARNRYAHFRLENPHPEATVKSLFGKVWYEGYPAPAFVWQSTGGSDEFEPKLSLIPLIFGTLKGTFYAMIFSVPLAVLAAIYVSQFAPAWLARLIKPTVEIMAALPSVVIGFVAGLYFAPRMEKILMAVLLYPWMLLLVFALVLAIWRQVPEQHRLRVPVGWEMWIALPILALSVWLALSLAHPVELALFGGDIKIWLYEKLGVVYDTRNSIVVGFALGFAVVPIIFTVAEDALSNVPDSLTSAALALGASRWQTVRRVVLPAAAGGIFAAIMLGFGRAVGETMIVLMATGNTPILDFSPFNGFRAMSACIAVEIPEAPVGGTLYRVLFLVGLLLFTFTFFINTLSAQIGERLRKKYARF